MPILVRSALFAVGLGFAAVTANAQAYYPGYYPPGYSAYTYPTYDYYSPRYYNYSYPWYSGYPSYYSSATPYNDPYVGARPYSDSAGPSASGHVGY